MPAPKFKLISTFLLLSSLHGCSDFSEAADLRARGRVADSSSGTVALGLGSSKPYRPIAVPAPGTLAGMVAVQDARTDSVVAVGRDAQLCGDSASVTEANATTMANSLVWVDGIAAGKPFPEVRRETITIERCRIQPRMVAVVARSTINVFSRDRLTHDTWFYREGAGDPVEHVHTVDAGQVVPSEKIANAPGIVEARCKIHPWVRAYVAVFDHPYFAVSDDAGSFKIDGLPPGTYTLKIWREGLQKPLEQRVTVLPGGSGRLDLAVSLN